MKSVPWLRSVLRAPFKPLQLPRTVHVAMVGSGKAARFHLEALSRIQGVSVTGILNSGRSDPVELRSQYSIPVWWQNIDEAIDAGGFDVAVIAVTQETVFEVATRFLTAGIHCLIEKPLGIDSDQASRLAQLNARQKTISCVAYNRRFYSSVLQADALVSQLGTPYSVHIEAHERLQLLRTRGRHTEEQLKGRLIRNTTHILDFFVKYLGAPLEIKKIENDREWDGVVADFMALIRFDKNGTGSFVSHWRSPGENQVVLYGDDYRLTIDLSRNSLAIKGPAECRGQLNAYDQKFVPGVYLQDHHFLDCVCTGKTDVRPACSLDEAAALIRLAEQLY